MPSCFLLKYDNKWTNLKNDTRDDTTSVIEIATANTKFIGTTTSSSFNKNVLLLNNTADQEFSSFNENFVQADESTILSENGIENEIENENDTYIERILNKYHGKNVKLRNVKQYLY